MGREDKHFEPGRSREIFNLGSFRFLPQVCYDLRFPVFSRNRGDYDVLFYVANWLAPRQQVWEILTKGRAIENQAYVLAAAQYGKDGASTWRYGRSMIVDPWGTMMAAAPEVGEAVLLAEVQREHVLRRRQQMPVLEMRRPDIYGK